MPYVIVPEDGKHNVYKRGADGKPTGRRLGSHDTAKDARAQIAAIEADEGSKSFALFRQEEVNYVTLSGTQGQACANCRWFKRGYTYDGEPIGYECHLVQNWPNDILPTGWCNRWESEPAPEQYELPARPVYLVEAPGEGEKMSADSGVLQKALKTLLGLFRQDEVAASGFKLLDNGEWFGWWSNNYKDRDGEIFTYAAQGRFAEMVKSGALEMPVLDYWHIPGTEHGVANWVGQVGPFLCAKGTFYDNALGEGFRNLYKSGRAFKMSHEFLYPRAAKQNGVYHLFYTKKVSSLPPHAAANPFTGFDGGVKMQVTDEQYKDLVAAVGEPKAKEIRDQATRMAKMLDEAGIEKKAQAGVPLQDDEARKQIGDLTAAQKTTADAITTMATAIKGLQDANTAHADEVKALKEAVEKHGEDIKTIGDFLRGQFQMQPRASTSKATVVEETDPALKFLKTKNEKAGKKSIIQQIVSGEVPDPNASAAEGAE